MIHQDFEYKEYPSAKEYPKEINLEWFKQQYQNPSFKFIDKNTNIVSMGSCFANEIAKYFVDEGFNYPIYEKSKANFNCDWNLVFTPLHINMIGQYSFDPFNFAPAERWWPTDDPEKVRDPYRRNVIYNKETAGLEFDSHTLKSRRALENSDVIILTLGLTEYWKNTVNHYAFYRVPPKKLYDKNPGKYSFETLNYPYYCSLLISLFIELVRKNNKKAKFILSVSPIPLHATFRLDVDVVTANQQSKSTLIGVCNELINNIDIFYFPSYEFVLSQSNPFVEDNRHVKLEVKQEVFELFKHMFVRGE